MGKQTKQVIVLCCGGRDFDDTKLVRRVMLVLKKRYSNLLIIHGAARGADTLYDQEAKRLGIDRQLYPADWNKYKLAAGAIRNQRMLDEGQPDFVIAFPGGKGTADMCRRAKKQNVPVKCVRIKKEKK